MENETWKIDFYEFDTNLIIKPMAANTNERIAWLEENYTLIPKIKIVCRHDREDDYRRDEDGNEWCATCGEEI